MNCLARLRWLAALVMFSLLNVAIAADKPNFVIINVDDLGYADIGPFGSTNRTPSLDQMAAEGRKLLSHYAAPVCSPSRAALLTGSYPKRALAIPHVLFPNSAAGLHPNEVTIAEVLKTAGYATACVGKWHLGDQPQFLPTRQGFDTYFGLPYSNDMGPSGDGTKSNYGVEPKPQSAANKQAANKQAAAKVTTGSTGGGQPPLPLLENEYVIERVRGEEQQSLTRRYTEHAVEFIREHKDDPFFLYLPHSAVHFPLYPSEPFRGKSPSGLHGDWCEEVDWSVGEVLNTIRSLGLEKQTFVLFTSDNGGPINHGASNGPLRGAKGQTHEGGIRVCTIAWWPGTIPAGTSTNAITSMMDVLPTFAVLAGAEIPSDRKLDGLNVWPVLVGDSETGPRDTFLYHRGFELEAVRSGPWKLRLKEGELYHLDDDIGEAHDVAAQYPDVVARLTEIAKQSDADLGQHEVGPGCRPLGNEPDHQPMIAADGRVRNEFARTAGEVLK